MNKKDVFKLFTDVASRESLNRQIKNIHEIFLEHITVISYFYTFRVCSTVRSSVVNSKYVHIAIFLKIILYKL